jgi:hypothetical protein
VPECIASVQVIMTNEGTIQTICLQDILTAKSSFWLEQKVIVRRISGCRASGMPDQVTLATGAPSRLRVCQFILERQILSSLEGVAVAADEPKSSCT